MSHKNVHLATCLCQIDSSVIWEQTDSLGAGALISAPQDGFYPGQFMTHKDEMRHTVFKHGHIQKVGLLFCLFCLSVFIIKCETSYTCLSRVLNMFVCILLDMLCTSCLFVFLRFHQISLFLIALFFCVTACLILMSFVLSGVTHITHILSSLPLV